MDLRFVTKNEYKFSEFEKLFEGTGHRILQSTEIIDEIQTEDLESLVLDKLIKAYNKIRRPVFVHHTGLQLEKLAGLPNGLTEIFWERLQNERLCNLFSDTSVIAVTLIAYCDGKSLKTFRGEARGKIAPTPRGPEGFQWDPIFIPEGFSETFAEMGDRKHAVSMRRLAINQFVAYLQGRT
jgi:XTP/dITP diphosphohydrolase